MSAPTISTTYREELARMLRAHLDANIMRVAHAFLSDTKFAPSDPQRDDTARTLARKALMALMKLTPLLLLGLALVGRPAPVHAMHPAAETQVAESTGMTCSNVERLAGILETEAGTIPNDAHPLIAAIVVSEAHSRNMNVCALSETGFLATWRYAQAHPDSWHAARFADPQAWAVAPAHDALTRGPQALNVHHFDGAPHADDVFVIGSVHFQP